MNTQAVVPDRQNRKGFTLVELLVVIAIIGILAGIVIPRIGPNIRRANYTAAVGDIQQITTSLTAILSDTGRGDFKKFLMDPPDDSVSGGGYTSTTAQAVFNAEYNLGQAMTNNAPATYLGDGVLQQPVQDLTEAYTTFFYELLRQGKNADVAIDLRPEIRQKLANSYLDLGDDPWGQPYQFWMGPMRGEPIQFFRSYRVPDSISDTEDMELSPGNVYVYDDAARQDENKKVPGAPPEDWTKSLEYNNNSAYTDTGLYGFPAPKDLAVYVYSKGRNNLPDANAVLQHMFGAGDVPYYGGGDDVNNWDKSLGWTAAP